MFVHKRQINELLCVDMWTLLLSSGLYSRISSRLSPIINE